jgi:transcriptional regulator with PAS, ATPase and Fis domain
MSTLRSAPYAPIAPLPERFSTAYADRVGPEIVGSSVAMRRLRLQIRRIGPHFRTVLVRGGAGTGKELVGRALHEMSQAADGLFEVRRAAAFGDTLAERQDDFGLLDWVRKNVKRGTLFLDGIDEMSLAGQDALLRVLRRDELIQGRGDELHRLDLRIVAATGEDLRILVAAGRFRQELYQRLATADIVLPPLRERMEDLPELVTCFIDRLALVYERGVLRVADEAMQRMMQYSWSGNVRELEVVLLNSVLQCEGGVIESSHLPELTEQTAKTTGSTSILLQDVVEQHVLRVLKDFGGNKLRAAEALGISRSTLYRMLEGSATAEAAR